MRIAAAVAAAALSVAIDSHAGELHVLSGGAAQQVLKAITPRFESQAGGKVDLRFSVVGAIEQKLAAGEKPDLVLLPAQLLEALEKKALFRARSTKILGRVAIGVVVREGAAAPDVSSPDAVKALLLRARSIVLPDPKLTPSGIHLMRTFREMGIAAAIDSRLTFRNAIDGGVQLVRDGDADVGLFLVTEVLPVKGVELAGALPEALQGYVLYAAAISSEDASGGDASRFVEFLGHADLREAWRTAGFEPVPR